VVVLTREEGDKRRRYRGEKEEVGTRMRRRTGRKFMVDVVQTKKKNQF